jgi:nondiscriminating glutamyl-tRNA synthetase
MMTEKNNIRVRFAPSPTGELHIGGLRSALTNYLFTRKNNGTFILRSEDTDRTRLVEGAAQRQIMDLQWAGITIDEGVTVDGSGNVIEIGEYGPYIQSQRLDIYRKYAQKLLDQKKAYYCFCSAERLDEMRKTQQAQKQAPKYDRHCLSLSEKDVQERLQKGEKYVVRFKIPEGNTVFDDLVYGHIEVDNNTLDDQVIMKSDGFPTYHLAVVVDDHLMKISHVFRGAEWIASTPKHILLYNAFGWSDDVPVFCHMANILNADRKKLSKREGSVSVADFRVQGYTKEAIVNFIALLGWNPKTEQEIFTMKELIDQFDTKKMNKAGGVFDRDRLSWIAKEHMKKMAIDDIYDRAINFLEKKEYYHIAPSVCREKSYVKRVITVEQDRLEKLTDIGEENQFFFTDNIVIDKELLQWKENSDKQTHHALIKARDILQDIDESKWTRTDLESILMTAAGEKRGDFFWPLRAALTGEKRSPSPFDCAWVIGKERTITRLDHALELFL